MKHHCLSIILHFASLGLSFLLPEVFMQFTKCSALISSSFDEDEADGWLLILCTLSFGFFLVVVLAFRSLMSLLQHTSKWFLLLHFGHLLPQAGYSSFVNTCFCAQNLHFPLLAFFAGLTLWTLPGCRDDLCRAAVSPATHMSIHFCRVSVPSLSRSSQVSSFRMPCTI